MSLYSTYYFTSSPAIVELDLIEIQHFRFSPTVFRLCRNCGIDGVTVTHEGGAGPFLYTYLPMTIERLGVGTDMDQSLRVSLGDVGEILPQQLELIDNFNAGMTKPIIRYRCYRSDDLVNPLTTVPAVFEMKRISFNDDGCSFEAVAPYLNSSGTGVKYTIQKFPTMKSFFKNR